MKYSGRIYNRLAMAWVENSVRAECADMAAEADTEIERLGRKSASEFHDRVREVEAIRYERDEALRALAVLRLQGDVAARDIVHARLRSALLDLAATHAWQCFGECRAFDKYGHTGPTLSSSEADAAARAALTPNAEVSG